VCLKDDYKPKYETIETYSYDVLKQDKKAYADAFRIQYENQDYVGGKQDNMYALIGIEDDGKKPDAQAFEFRPLGKGVQNIPLLYKTAVECGAEWIIAEQDEPSMGLSRMECAEISINTLRSAAK